MPRRGSIQVEKVAGKEVFSFTSAGLVELKNLAVVGCPPSEMAQHFGVSESWMVQQLKTNPVVQESRDLGESEGRVDVRKALHTAAIAGDMKAATFLAERRLKMTKTVDVNHQHTINVIGSMPNYKLESENWLEKFGPADRPREIEAIYEEVPGGPGGRAGMHSDPAGSVPAPSGDQDEPPSAGVAADAGSDR